MRSPISPAGLTRPASINSGIASRASAGAFNDLAQAASSISDLAQQHEQFAMQAAVSKARRDFDKRALEAREKTGDNVEQYEEELFNLRNEIVAGMDGRFSAAVERTLVERGHDATMALAEQRLAKTRAEAEEAMAIENARSLAEIESFVELNGAKAFDDPRFKSMISEHEAIINARRDSGHSTFSAERAEYEKKKFFDRLQVLAAKPEIDAAFSAGGYPAALERAEAISRDESFELSSEDRASLKNELVQHAAFMERVDAAKLAEERQREIDTERAVAKRAKDAETEMVRLRLQGKLTTDWLLKNRDLDASALKSGLSLLSDDSDTPEDNAYALGLMRRARAGEDVSQEVANGLSTRRFSLSTATRIDEEYAAAQDNALKNASKSIDAAYAAGLMDGLDPMVEQQKEAALASLRAYRRENPGATEEQLLRQADVIKKQMGRQVYSAIQKPNSAAAKPKSLKDVRAQMEALSAKYQAGQIDDATADAEMQALEAFERHFEEMEGDQ